MKLRIAIESEKLKHFKAGEFIELFAIENYKIRAWEYVVIKKDLIYSISECYITYIADFHLLIDNFIQNSVFKFGINY